MIVVCRLLLLMLNRQHNSTTDILMLLTHFKLCKCTEHLFLFYSVSSYSALNNVNRLMFHLINVFYFSDIRYGESIVKSAQCLRTHNCYRLNAVHILIRTLKSIELKSCSLYDVTNERTNGRTNEPIYTHLKFPLFSDAHSARLQPLLLLPAHSHTKLIFN